jgi:hypothetical protein
MTVWTLLFSFEHPRVLAPAFSSVFILRFLTVSFLRANFLLLFIVTFLRSYLSNIASNGII